MICHFFNHLNIDFLKIKVRTTTRENFMFKQNYFHFSLFYKFFIMDKLNGNSVKCSPVIKLDRECVQVVSYY